MESARKDVIPHVHTNAEQADQITKNSFNNPKFTLGTGTGAINVHKLKSSVTECKFTEPVIA